MELVWAGGILAPPSSRKEGGWRGRAEGGKGVGAMGAPATSPAKGTDRMVQGWRRVQTNDERGGQEDG